ncbi:hypothetical protein N0V90_009106 [Kalmusia sp. IMI 367209]|nr:hypothetical protein N0V90_009106 [Kalmusia sp. IMI 367209]
MELHHRPCVLPSNAPDLPEPDSSIPSRVLQERSANRRHDYSEGTSSWKRSPSPIENVYSGRLGGYFTGNHSSQFHGDKSETQIEIETKKLLKLLRNCEKYTKYRDRQPSTAKDKEQRWPDHLEEAFFRGKSPWQPSYFVIVLTSSALVRWPPMGRRKQMLDGQLRGRNELVADSIQKDTGEPRTRKQVSSHIQVLKPMLAEQPQTKLQSDQEDPPFTVANFDMFVEVAKRHVHDFTQLKSNSRQSDLYVTDIASWHKQYPEFRFHHTDDFDDHQVIVCDASIKIMTMERPADADLAITFDLRSQIDLSAYDSLECRTRFFDNGKTADQQEGERGQERRVKYTRTQAEFHAQHSLMRVKFGSKFWAHQMQKLGHVLAKAAAQVELTSRTRYESIVRKELQLMTATQSIYGIKNGETKCLLTILWRFSQTRTSHEAGRMIWRIVTFAPCKEKRWAKEEELDRIRNAKELVPTHHTPSNTLLSIPTSNPHSIYPTPLDFPNPRHAPAPARSRLAHGPRRHAHGFLAPRLWHRALARNRLLADALAAVPLPLARQRRLRLAAKRLPRRKRLRLQRRAHHHAGCLEPAINLGAYEPYNTSLNPSLNAHNTTLPNLSSITGLVDASQHGLSDGNPFSDLGMGVSMGAANCYATKPSWHHPSLISHLESAAEAFGVGELLGGGPGGGGPGGDDVGHGGVGHGMMGDAALWRFGEDTGVGADHRRDSKVGEGVEFGVDRDGARAWRI